MNSIANLFFNNISTFYIRIDPDQVESPKLWGEYTFQAVEDILREDQVCIIKRTSENTYLVDVLCEEKGLLLFLPIQKSERVSEYILDERVLSTAIATKFRQKKEDLFSIRVRCKIQFFYADDTNIKSDISQLLKDAMSNLEIFEGEIQTGGELADDNARDFTFIIDTNAFVTEPNIIELIMGSGKIVIPAKVLDELDKISLRKSISRVVKSAIAQIFKYKDEEEFLIFAESEANNMSEDYDKYSPDNKIISVAKKYINNNPLIITNDKMMTIKASKLADIFVLSVDELKVQLKLNSLQTIKKQKLLSLYKVSKLLEVNSDSILRMLAKRGIIICYSENTRIPESLFISLRNELKKD